jgi:SMI1 / KNR4 family (SUKH-1)
MSVGDRITDRWSRLAERKGFSLSAPPPAGAIDEAEARLGHPLSDALRSLYAQTDGFQDEWGCSCVMCLADLVTENEQMRNDAENRAHYMPFDSLLFFGQMGNGDLLFHPVLTAGVPADVFLWDHEDDSRRWYARDVPEALKRPCSDERD